jgi:hypothetical protein
VPRLGLVEAERKKNSSSYTMLVERDSRRIRLGLLSHGGYPRAAAPGAFALRQPLWAGTNTHAGGGPTTSMTNTITIL